MHSLLFDRKRTERTAGEENKGNTYYIWTFQMKETTGFQLFPRDSITPSRLYFYICFCTQQTPFLDMITRSFLGAIKESRNNSNSHSVNAHMDLSRSVVYTLHWYSVTNLSVWAKYVVVCKIMYRGSRKWAQMYWYCKMLSRKLSVMVFTFGFWKLQIFHLHDPRNPLRKVIAGGL